MYMYYCFVFVCCFGVVLFVFVSDLFVFVELSDQEFFYLCGCYVLLGWIVSFGVIMSSIWQNVSGQVFGVCVDLQVWQNLVCLVFNVILVDWLGNVLLFVVGNGQVFGGVGLVQIQGVSQSICIVGDYNSVSNGVSIEVCYGEVLLLLLGGMLLEGVLVFSGEVGMVKVMLNGGVL